MQPSQIAVIWATYEEQQRLEHESSRAHASSRPSFARRFRRFVFRGQLGPVGSHTPAWRL